MPVNIRGKEYSTVDERLRAFRLAFPASDGWGITSEVLNIDDDQVMITCRITDPVGRVVGQGHSQEHKAGSRINTTSMLENAETSAIGRALASVGYLGDGNFAIASAEEVNQAITSQEDWWQCKLDDHGLTVADVNRWADTIGYKTKFWDWQDKTKHKFFRQLKDGDIQINDVQTA